MLREKSRVRTRATEGKHQINAAALSSFRILPLPLVHTIVVQNKWAFLSEGSVVTYC